MLLHTSKTYLNVAYNTRDKVIYIYRRLVSILLQFHCLVIIFFILNIYYLKNVLPIQIYS